MQDTYTLFEKGSLKIKILNHTPDAIKNLVYGTAWGSPDKIRFKQLKTEEYLPLLPTPQMDRNLLERQSDWGCCLSTPSGIF